MRVLVTTPTFFPIVGGAELLIRDVLNVWAEYHEVLLLTPYLRRESKPFWIEDAEFDASCNFEVKRFDDRVSLMRMRGHRAVRGLIPPMSLTAVPMFAREARKMHADVMVGFFGVPYGLPLTVVSARLGIPYSLVFCGTDLPSPRTVRVPHWGDYLRFAASRANKAVYVSRFCFDILCDRPFDPDHDKVIFGGVDMSESTRLGDTDALRRKLGIGPDDIMLFALQRLGAEKRVDILLRAFAALPKMDRKVRLVIGGQGPEAAPLEELAVLLKVRDRVVFTGHLADEKDLYYAASDIFVFHSLFETFGQVLVEAMRAGKPIVSVRAGAISEVVRHGHNGLLADPEDAEGLSRILAELITDDERRISMGKAGRERAKRLFDWDHARTQWIDVLERQVPQVQDATLGAPEVRLGGGE